MSAQVIHWVVRKVPHSLGASLCTNSAHLFLSALNETCRRHLGTQWLWFWFGCYNQCSGLLWAIVWVLGDPLVMAVKPRPPASKPMLSTQGLPGFTVWSLSAPPASSEMSLSPELHQLLLHPQRLFCPLHPVNSFCLLRDDSVSCTPSGAFWPLSHPNPLIQPTVQKLHPNSLLPILFCFGSS